LASNLWNDIKETRYWLWSMVFNPPLVWVDQDGHEEKEQVSRKRKWRTFRPAWTYSIFTTRQPCGCSKRYWGKQVMICWPHVKKELEL
jgi:hypothetical protein